MAIIWTNIANGETGASVRNKLNALGTEVSSTSSSFDTAVSNIAGHETRITSLENISHKIGFGDYNDSATATTPISVTGGAGLVDLTNDALGTYTTNTYLPSGISKLWDDVTNRFYFNELSLGDMVDIRCDIEVTTTANNQEIKLVLELGTSTVPFEIPYRTSQYKTTGTYKVNVLNGFYIGSNDTLTGGGRFRIESDANCTVKVNGWYVKVIAN